MTVIQTAAPPEMAAPVKRRSRKKKASPDPVVRNFSPEETWDIELPAYLQSVNLPEEDGEPLESNWHRAQIGLLIETYQQFRGQDKDYYAGGNMFIYYSSEQVRNRDYRGPDFFVVLHVDGSKDRKFWVVWEEHGRYPNLIIELISPRTRRVDRTTKKQLYAETFRTPEYIHYDPDELVMTAFRLQGAEYIDLTPDAHGRFWSEELKLWIGPWEGEYLGYNHIWLRFYTSKGELVLTKGEAEARRAEAEARRAAAEAQRATSAEAELARLRARLQEKGIDPDAL